MVLEPRRVWRIVERHHNRLLLDPNVSFQAPQGDRGLDMRGIPLSSRPPPTRMSALRKNLRCAAEELNHSRRPPPRGGMVNDLPPKGTTIDQQEAGSFGPWLVARACLRRRARGGERLAQRSEQCHPGKRLDQQPRQVDGAVGAGRGVPTAPSWTFNRECGALRTTSPAWPWVEAGFPARRSTRLPAGCSGRQIKAMGFPWLDWRGRLPPVPGTISLCSPGTCRG